MKQGLTSIKGFRDLYPQDKALQNYLFKKIRQVAALSGFEEYDGPTLEPIGLYLDKTSRELIDRQTFQVKTKKDETLVLRPEMTPTLARMVAQKANQIVYPAKLFNIGARFRYEAPQKGRAREFYQADFDILGGDPIWADAEILNVAVNIFLNLGAKKDDFIIYVNSRQLMNSNLKLIGISEEKIAAVINIIDKKDKVGPDIFEKLLSEATDKISATKIIKFLEEKQGFDDYFQNLFIVLQKWGIENYISLDVSVVRGLDYYTGLVFEARSKDLNRSLLGGGRYDNLIESFNPKLKISGVGFATSDVVLEEFLKDKSLLPILNTSPTRVLVTVFPGYEDRSVKLTNNLRKQEIPTEIYLGEIQISKQLDYANKKNIPYVVFIGPEEVKKNVVKLKNMKTGEQVELTLETLINKLKK